MGIDRHPNFRLSKGEKRESLDQPSRELPPSQGLWRDKTAWHAGFTGLEDLIEEIWAGDFVPKISRPNSLDLWHSRLRPLPLCVLSDLLFKLPSSPFASSLFKPLMLFLFAEDDNAKGAQDDLEVQA